MGLQVEIDEEAADDILVASLMQSFETIVGGHRLFLEDGTIPIYSHDVAVEHRKVLRLLKSMKRVLEWYGCSVELPTFESNKLE